MEPSTKFQTVDQYIASLSPGKRKVIKEMRRIVKAAAPAAEEVISYNMPALRWHGMLIFYAAWTEHIGFYGASPTIRHAFEKELAPYKQSKGTIQFPSSEPLPADLITRMVQYRLKENQKKAEMKANKKISPSISPKGRAEPEST